MDRTQIPGGVARVCRTLRAAGYGAYPVGGCVRDLLRGVDPADWDVTTSALPETVMALFERTVPTGVKHGTVTVLTEDGGVEVTTFRREGGYADGRHPDAVRFDAGLTEDLSRRDFTINAMALGPEGEIIDPCGGQSDLRMRLIRCVGDAERRFREDALRMLRAVRFSAQLGFAIESGTAQALRKCARRADGLSAERVRTELEKTLLSPWPERGERLFTWGLMDKYLAGPADPDLTVLHRTEAAPLSRWAALCGALADWGSIRSVGDFLRALRLDKKTISACEGGAALWRDGPPWSARDWRRALAGYGKDACIAAAAIGDALTAGAYTAALLEILEERPCCRVSDLALRGRDLTALGYSGTEIGAAQARLLSHVLDHPEDNRREVLLDILKREEAGD